MATILSPELATRRRPVGGYNDPPGEIEYRIGYGADITEG